MPMLTDAAPKPAAPLLSRRHWLNTWWSARSAVRSKLSLADFLRHQAAQYLHDLAARDRRLPLEITLEGRELRFRQVEPAARPNSAQPTTVDGGPAWEAELARRHGAMALEELADERAKQARLEEQLEEAARDVAGARAALAEAVADGRAAAVGARAAALHLRPMVPSAAWPRAALGLALGISLAEWWQLAVPFLNSSGVDVSDLGAEMQRAPLAVALPCLIAVGGTALLVWLAHLVSDHGPRALAEDATPRRRWIALAHCLGAGGLSLGLAVFFGGMRQGDADANAMLTAAATGSTSNSTPAVGLIAIAAALPYFTAMLWDWARARLARRDQVAEEVRALDLALRAREEVRERLEERVRMAQQAQAALRLERAGADVKVRRLGWMGEEAQRQANQEAWLTGEALHRARAELKAALESDLLAFLKAEGRATGRPTIGERAPVVLFTPEQEEAAPALFEEAA